MSARHTLVLTPEANWPYWLAHTDAGHQITVWDLWAKTRKRPVDIDDRSVVVYGYPEPIGTFCGAPIYVHPQSVAHFQARNTRDNYVPQHAKEPR